MQHNKAISALAAVLKKRFCIALFLCCCALLGAQASSLQTSEVSRFAFTCNDLATRVPVIDYPYVYLPNSYGFQVAEWDSTTGSFTEITNHGVEGMASEIAKVGNYLFVAVFYGGFTTIEPDMGALYRVDITNPQAPIAAGAVPCGNNELRFSCLRVVNGCLMAQKQENGLLQGIVIIDPATLNIIHSYPSYLRYELMPGNRIISRGTNAADFTIFDVRDSGLTASGSVTLPYEPNVFPYFITIHADLIATQNHTNLLLWQIDAEGVWTQLSSTNVNDTFPPVFCHGYLIFNDHTNNQSRFRVYDVSEPTLPELIHTQNFPDGVEISPRSDLMAAYGDFIFFPCGTYGCLCLRVDANAQVQFVSKCYRYNDLSSYGHKFGNYILQPFMYSGIACFDVSNPYQPEHSFSIIPDCSASIDLNGHYMFGQFSPLSQTNSYRRVYNISNLSQPVLIFEQLATQYNTIFCNYNEPDSFYLLNTQTSKVSKFTISNNIAYNVLEYNVGYALRSPAFVNDLLYLCEISDVACADLYVYSGLSDNNPQLAQIIPDLIPPPAYIYNAGNYLFFRNLTQHSTPVSFYHPLGTFQVENDIHWGYFRNYVCVNSELEVRFYNTNSYPTGFQTPDYCLPQFSYVGHIEWDDDYLYLYAQGYIAIYLYTASANEDYAEVPSLPGLKCYPNPASTDITVELKANTLKPPLVEIYNLKGQLLRKLEVTNRKQDSYRFVWDGFDVNGKRVAAGLYVVSSVTDSKRSNAKAILLGK